VGLDDAICSSDPVGMAEFDLGFCRSEAGYDIPAGRLDASCWPFIGQCSYGKSLVEDEFTISGPPDGTLIDFTAVLEIYAQGGCIMGPAFAYAGIRDGNLNASDLELDLCMLNGASFDTVLSIPVEAIVGTPLRMTYYVEAVIHDAPSTIRGIFSFENLPAGALVVSCNRFVQGPVQISPASWGRLKSVYR
jgi:hypothetical protein